MRKITFLLAAAVITLTCTNPHDQIRQRGKLVVGIEEGTPGFIELGSQSYGFIREVLEIYADSLGVELELSYMDQSRDMIFARNGADMAITLSSELHFGEWGRSTELCRTRMVMLATNRNVAKFRAAADSLSNGAIKGDRILSRSLFRQSDDYALLADAADGTIIEFSPRSGFCLIGEFIEKKCDLLICESGEGRIGNALVPNVSIVWEFPAEFGISAVCPPGGQWLGRNFARWYRDFRTTPEYAALYGVYLGDDSTTDFLDYGKNGGISVFDETFRRVGKAEGVDWRLLAAIGSVESGFNPYALSPRGAKGVMQIMPVVGRQFGIPDRDLMNPKENITAAAKSLKDLRRRLLFDHSTPESERIKVILGTYNAGIGRILGARAALRARGENPDSWDNISMFLYTEANNLPEDMDEADIEPVGETTNYVRKVVSKYQYYKQHFK